MSLDVSFHDLPTIINSTKLICLLINSYSILLMCLTYCNSMFNLCFNFDVTIKSTIILLLHTIVNVSVS